MIFLVNLGEFHLSNKISFECDAFDRYEWQMLLWRIKRCICVQMPGLNAIDTWLFVLLCFFLNRMWQYSWAFAPILTPVNIVKLTKKGFLQIPNMFVPTFGQLSFVKVAPFPVGFRWKLFPVKTTLFYCKMSNSGQNNRFGWQCWLKS